MQFVVAHKALALFLTLSLSLSLNAHRRCINAVFQNNIFKQAYYFALNLIAYPGFVVLRLKKRTISTPKETVTSEEID